MGNPTIDNGCNVCGKIKNIYYSREYKDQPGKFEKLCFDCDHVRNLDESVIVEVSEKSPKYKPITADGLTGWICPVCGSGVSPFISLCPCCSIPYKVTN